MNHRTNETALTCRRCGTCCRKGGPALHLTDRDLVDRGRIPLKHLFTIRQGEPACDNITGVIAPAATDIIKIKAQHDDSSGCCYFDEEQRICRQYDHRPIECQVLTCWNTTEIEGLYDRDRLTRAHLLDQVPGLWDLVQDHQYHCDYDVITGLVNRFKQDSDDPDPEARLLDIIRYDQSLRLTTLERTDLDRRVLDFLFGRPLYVTIRRFQLKLAQNKRGLTLVPID
jgi:Fe-S-cluster containining protein